ncbi:MAG: hypothetical protein M1820_000826 [Bogoriella megaspora]|nr:MAG: hypothetical protein M1820_000826 [Bogoriella megaspora]
MSLQNTEDVAATIKQVLHILEKDARKDSKGAALEQNTRQVAMSSQAPKNARITAISGQTTRPGPPPRRLILRSNDGPRPNNIFSEDTVRELRWYRREYSRLQQLSRRNIGQEYEAIPVNARLTDQSFSERPRSDESRSITSARSLLRGEGRVARIANGLDGRYASRLSSETHTTTATANQHPVLSFPRPNPTTVARPIASESNRIFKKPRLSHTVDADSQSTLRSRHGPSSLRNELKFQISTPSEPSPGSERISTHPLVFMPPITARKASQADLGQPQLGIPPRNVGQSAASSARLTRPHTSFSSSRTSWVYRPKEGDLPHVGSLTIAEYEAVKRRMGISQNPRNLSNVRSHPVKPVYGRKLLPKVSFAHLDQGTGHRNKNSSRKGRRVPSNRSEGSSVPLPVSEGQEKEGPVIIDLGGESDSDSGEEEEERPAPATAIDKGGKMPDTKHGRKKTSVIIDDDDDE